MHSSREAQDLGAQNAINRINILEAINFAFARQDPWVLNGDNRSEMSKFAQTCSSRLHKRVLNQFDFQLKLSGLKLVINQNDRKIANIGEHKEAYRDDLKMLNNTLKFAINEEPPNWFGGSKILSYAWRRFTIWPYSILLVAVVAYLTIKISIVSYLSYHHDKILRLLQVDITSNASHIGKCYQRENIKFQPANVKTELEKINQQMHQIGAAFLTTPGAGALTHNIFAMLVIAFFFTSMLLISEKHIRVDHLSFIENPLGERARVQMKLGYIVRNVTAFLASKFSSDPCLHFISRCDCTPNGMRNKVEPLDRGVPARANRVTQLRFIDSVVEIIEANLIRPVNLTSRWHEALSCLADFMNIVGFAISWSASFYSYALWCSHEIYHATARRLALLECQSWDSNATLVDIMDYWTDPISDDDLKVYKLYDGTLGYLVYLALLVEAKYYFTNSRLLLMGEICFTITIYSVWSSLYATLYITGFMHQILRMVQLEEQICDCVKVLSVHEHQFETLKSGEGRCETIRYSDQTLKIRAEVLRRLVVSYLNYELFRRDYLHFENFSSFLFSQVALLTSNTFIVCYLIATNLNTTIVVPIIWILVAIVLFMDLYLATISYNSKKYEKIERQILRLVTRCTTSSICNSYPVELWRRQIRIHANNQGVFSDSAMFVRYMSYEKLLAFNAYLIVLLALIIMKSLEHDESFFFFSS